MTHTCKPDSQEPCEDCWKTQWKCSNQGCTIDSFGVNHGHNCNRARFILELQEAWK